MHNRIKEIRTKLGLTQQEFADAIKVKRNTVATYEMGRSVPSDAAIALICKEFYVNERWLRTGEGEPFIKRTKNEEITAMLMDIQVSDEESFKRRFISALTNLDEDGWHMLENLIDDISGKNKD